MDAISVQIKTRNLLKRLWVEPEMTLPPQGTRSSNWRGKNQVCNRFKRLRCGGRALTLWPLCWCLLLWHSPHLCPQIRQRMTHWVICPHLRGVCVKGFCTFDVTNIIRLFDARLVCLCYSNEMFALVFRTEE